MTVPHASPPSAPGAPHMGEFTCSVYHTVCLSLDPPATCTNQQTSHKYLDFWALENQDGVTLEGTARCCVAAGPSAWPQAYLSSHSLCPPPEAQGTAVMTRVSTYQGAEAGPPPLPAGSSRPGVHTTHTPSPWV